MPRESWRTKNPIDFKIAQRLRLDGYTYVAIAGALGVNVRTLTRALDPEQRQRHLDGVKAAKGRAALTSGRRSRTKMVQTWIDHADFNPRSGD